MEQLDEVKKAKAQIVEGSLTIWNARLDAMVKSGDLKRAIDEMLTPIERAEGDNCDCQCGPPDLRPGEIIASRKVK